MEKEEDLTLDCPIKYLTTLSSQEPSRTTNIRSSGGYSLMGSPKDGNKLMVHDYKKKFNHSESNYHLYIPRYIVLIDVTRCQ